MINTVQFSKNILNFITAKKIDKFFYLFLFLLWVALIDTLIAKENPVGLFLGIVMIFTSILFLSDTLSLAGLIFFIFMMKGTSGEIFGILPRQAIWASDAIIVFLFLKSSGLGLSQKKFEWSRS